MSNASTALSIDSSASEDEVADDGDVEGGGEEGDLQMRHAAQEEEEGEGDEEEDDEDEGEEQDSDPFSSQPHLPSPRKTSHFNPEPEPAAAIPLDLINVLLHSFFKQPNTRLAKDANAAVGMYIETFVREGLARADWARVNGWEGELEGLAGGTGGEGGGGYLEVEDLERGAPQLVLDF